MKKKTLPKYRRWLTNNELEKKVLNGGFLWNMLSLLGFHVIIGFYLSISTMLSVNEGIVTYLAGVAFLIAGTVTYMTEEQDTESVKWWFLSSILISASWICLGLVSFYSWGNIDNAEKVWTVGFMAMMIGWYANNAILAISLSTIIFSYVGLAACTMDVTGYTPGMVVLSGGKFVLLAAVFQTSIGRLYRFARCQYQEKSEEVSKLESAINKDELTGVLNRKGFNAGVNAAIRVAESKNINLSLLIMDVDLFKQYNDSLGHPAGDKCLISLANTILKECSRETDIVARIGGEEFAVILTGCDETQAEMVADRIQAAIKEHAIPHPNSMVSNLVTVSIGISQYDGAGFESLYHSADKALYKAKYLGKNMSCICRDDECTCKNCRQ